LILVFVSADWKATGREQTGVQTESSRYEEDSGPGKTGKN
jgi:hypothetical protein